MSGPFQLTPLAETRPGMVLSDVVLDDRGNVLLAQGVVLTESMLASLGRHGVDMLLLKHAVDIASNMPESAVWDFIGAGSALGLPLSLNVRPPSHWCYDTP